MTPRDELTQGIIRRPKFRTAVLLAVPLIGLLLQALIVFFLSHDFLDIYPTIAWVCSPRNVMILYLLALRLCRES